MPLPPGTSADEFAEAVRFALAGGTRTTTPVLSPGAGYGWVEVAFVTGDGAVASVFRGVDRRGVRQVSLREDEGGRITSGPDDVAARLQELVGATVADLGRATFVSLDQDPLEGWTGLPAGAGETAPTGPPAALDLDAVDAARNEVADAADALRRALQVRSLRERSDRDHDELTALGSRLRRERTASTAALGKIVAERDGIRTRLHGSGESRVAGALFGSAAASSPSSPERTTPPAASAADRPVADPSAAARAQSAVLGDHDAAGLADDLRARLIQCDALAAPLQSRLERLDDAIAALDAEAGRAARALHRPPPPKGEAVAGLGPDESVADVAARVVHVGDLIHQASVERDALLAQGAYGVAESACAVQEALRRLGAACCDAEGASAVVGREPVSPEEAEALPPDTDAAALQERLEFAADEIVARAVRRAEADRATPPTGAPARRGDRPESADGSATPAGRLEALAGRVAGRVTQGRFPRARIGERGRLELVARDDAARTPWSALEPVLRARVALALHLQLGEECLRGPCATSVRTVVLDAMPAGFASDDELASFASEHAPRVAQVLYGRPAAPAPGLPLRRDASD